MKIKKTYKKMIASFALLSVGGIIAAIASSCGVVDSSNFKLISATDISTETKYQDINNTPSVSVKNLVYGTDQLNNGNYVLTVATETDATQQDFINASPTTPWHSEWSRAVTSYAVNGKFNIQQYPNGINFLLYQDLNGTSSENWNPYSKYPDKSKDDTATDAEKANSNKYRREDQEATTYRDIADLILNTYGGSVASWLITGNQAAEKPGANVTNVMVIAFRNQDGVISPSFYNGSSASASTSAATANQLNTKAAVPTAFSSWLDGVYK